MMAGVSMYDLARYTNYMFYGGFSCVMLLSVSFFCGEVMPMIDFSSISGTCLTDVKTFGDWFARGLGLQCLVWLSGPSMGVDPKIFQKQAVVFNVGVWLMEIHFTFFMPPFSGMILTKLFLVLLTFFIMPVNIAAYFEVEKSDYAPVP